jgi:hypothetical protein
MGSNAGAQIGGLGLMLGGKVLGSFIGGPIGGAIGGLAGGLIGSLLFNRSSGSKPLVSDSQLATSSYGHFIPIIYGTVRLAATVIWETSIQTSKESAGGGGGKGFGGGTTVYAYHQSAAFAFCQGPARLQKIWLDGKLFYDNTSQNPTELTKYRFDFHTYTGTEDQLPDAVIEQWVNDNVDPPATPAYRGLCYFVFEQIDLAHFGNRMPNVTATWATDVNDSILTTKFTSWADTPSYHLQDVAVDWASARVYTLSAAADAPAGAVRVYDMISGQQTDETAGTAGPVGFGSSGGTAIAVEQGGNVYIASGPVSGSGVTSAVISTLNPNTLQVTNQVSAPACPVEGVPIYYMVPFQIVSVLSDPYDMLFVAFGQDDYPYPFIFNPKTGLASPFLAIHAPGLDGWVYCVLGKQDTTAGIQELWILHSNPLLDGHNLYIYKVVVTGSDPSGLTADQVGLLTYVDFGVSVDNPSAFSFAFGTSAVYDASDDTLIISSDSVAEGEVAAAGGGSESRAIKWSPSGGTEYVVQREITWANTSSAYNFTDTGIVGTGIGDQGYFVTTMNSGAQEGPLTNTTVFPYYVYGYDSGRNALVMTDHMGFFGVVYLQRTANNLVPVADIILDLCQRAGIDQASIDVSQVTAATWGYAINEEKSFGNAIGDLCQTYQIDMTESDYMLKFVPKGQAPIVTIDQADLGSIVNNDPSQYWEAKRAIEQEMPLQVNVRYSDPALDYQPGASYAKRIALPAPTVFSKRIKSLDLPVVCMNPDARHIAEQWLYTMWAERDTFKSMIAQQYLWLDPTDNINVQFDNGDLMEVRIQTSEIGDDYTMKLDLCSEDVSVFVDSGSKGGLISFTPQTVVVSAGIDLLQFNVPLLLDTDDTGGTELRIYYAGGPIAPVSSTTTAMLYQSTDGSSWPAYAGMAYFVDWGTTTMALGDTVAAFATDYINTLTFTLTRGSSAPVSCAYGDMMNGVNAVLVGTEIVQFMQVTDLGNSVYELSILLRGRRGTEYATGTHVPGEPVIFLEIGKVQAGRLPLSEKDQTTLWKLVPSGRFIDTTPADSFAYRG